MPNDLHSAAVDRARAVLSIGPHPQTLAEFTFDGVIAALWRTKKLDTAAISKILGSAQYPESRVANRLAQLRDAGTL